MPLSPFAGAFAGVPFCREENAKVKQGEVPEEWEEEPNKLRQKDVDARWTKKNGESHYGYKNHISIDNQPN